jgi:hypothetical protein
VLGVLREQTGQTPAGLLAVAVLVVLAVRLCKEFSIIQLQVEQSL